MGSPSDLPGAPSVPSLDQASASPSNQASLGAKRTGGAPPLPTNAGQYWEQYDLKPYTKELTGVDRPHQAVIDWILRDTGTDVWFTEPFGFINADRDTLRVYHNEQMHKLVRQSYERFVNGTTVPQLYGMRFDCGWQSQLAHARPHVAQERPSSIGWRASVLGHQGKQCTAHGHVAWSQRFQRVANVSVTTYNGQPQVLEQLRTRNLCASFKLCRVGPALLADDWRNPRRLSLQISPLINLDKTIDIVVKCHIDQVERLSNVTLDLPLPTGQTHSGQIQVPQMASWRLHERFVGLRTTC